MKIKIIILIFTITVLSLGFVAPILAQDFRGAETQNAAFIKAAGLGTAPIAVVVSDIIKIFLSFLGVIFIVLIIYAGFMWMTAAGNADKVGKAKNTMIAAIIGLAVVLSAYAITDFIIDRMIDATSYDG